MVFTSAQIQDLAQHHYNLQVTVKPLPGEIDLNFLVTTPDGTAYNLKIANPNERPENLAFQNEMMKRLTAAGLESFEAPFPSGHSSQRVNMGAR